MRTQNQTGNNSLQENEASLSQKISTTDSTVSEVRYSNVAYNELSDFPVQNLDPVEMVEQNLKHLSDLQARMRFMMKEIRYLLKA